MKLYYNPKLDILGLHIRDNYIRIFIHEGMRVFMYNTGEWVEVGEL